jgi:copper(I)-binding protein
MFTKFFSVLCIFTATVLSSNVASAAEVKFDQARAYLPMKGGRATASYVELKNETAKEAKIEVVSAEGFKAAEMHETFETDGKMGMRKIENLTLKSQASDSLVPGGKHIMLFDPTRDFKDGDTISITLKVNNTARKVAFKMVPRVSKESEPHH